MLKVLNWQKTCKEDFGKKDDITNFVIMAGTGTGKTVAGALCIQSHLLRNSNDICVVGVPLRQVKNGWQKTLKTLGICAATKISDLALDTKVIVTTYSGAAGIINYIIREMPKRKVLFVFDEFHHLEETNTWANSFLEFDEKRCSRRILLSGTPWHETGKLPEEWVRYDDNEELICHVKRTYGQDVNDDDGQRNTNPVKFTPFRSFGKFRYGESEPIIYDSETTIKSDGLGLYVDFNCYEQLMEREGLIELLAAAEDSLRKKRLINPRAGGIVFVSCKEAGTAVQEFFLKTYKKQAHLIVSDDPLSHRRIDDFRMNSDEWLIAIDMISEGADIPRLRVAADLSNRKTMLHIVQRWGRVLRRMRYETEPRNPIENDCDSEIFFVNHAQLKYVAEKIEEEIKKEKKDKKTGGEPPPPGKPKEILSQHGERREAIFKGKTIEEQIEQVAEWILRTNFNQIRTDKLGFAGAVNLAKFLILKNQIPDEFLDDCNPDLFLNQFRLPEEFDKPYVPTREDIIASYTKITNRLMMTVFDGDGQATMLAIAKQQGVNKWSKDHKTMDELLAREKACKELAKLHGVQI